jgi:hypothetical protein
MPFRRLIVAIACSLLIPPLIAMAQSSAPRQSTSDADSEITAVNGKWVRTIREALVAEKFDDLEAMAAQYRTTKSRVPGGDWQLHLFYAALNGPRAGDTNMPDHLAHLQRWMAAKPQSVTPAVAYASSMTKWAWQARTGAQADNVTEEGWRLFKERAAGARAALDAVAHQPLDGQWYSDYMTVALAQDWDNDRMKALFEKGSGAFPGYFYLYKQYADYLQPKWDGKPGEAGFFAKSAADAIGGSDGDLLYYEIGASLLGRSNGNVNAKSLDWPRLQRGYTALVTRYGTTNHIENELAVMAFKERDATVAQAQFVRIGDRFASSAWKDRTQFDRARDWAAAVTAGAAPSTAKGLIPLGP